MTIAPARVENSAEQVGPLAGSSVDLDTLRPLLLHDARRKCVIAGIRFPERDQDDLARQAVAAGTGDKTQGLNGLECNQAYAVLAAEEVAAEATPYQDAFAVTMVKLAAPGLASEGLWRGAWGAGHALWDKYPAICEQLRPAEAAAQRQFWMSLDDFAASFSIVLSCKHYTVPAPAVPTGAAAGDSDSDSEDESENANEGKSEDGRGKLCRKVYRGRWTPGDPLSGSGGGTHCSWFATNPHYPITVERDGTRLLVALTAAQDDRWVTGTACTTAEGAPDGKSSSPLPPVPPARVRPAAVGAGFGFVLVKLKGGVAPRLHRFQSKCVVARSSPPFTTSGSRPHSVEEFVLRAGRYAVVPCTLDPLSRAMAFDLELVADAAVEFEQSGARQQDVDVNDLLSSDEEDEEKGSEEQAPTATKELTSQWHFAFEEEERLDYEDDSKMIEALHLQVGDLAGTVLSLESEMKALAGKLAKLEAASATTKR